MIKIIPVVTPIVSNINFPEVTNQSSSLEENNYSSEDEKEEKKD